MMLVLVSVFMATILAASYLASRDNSVPIARNISNAAVARWAALSGVETAVAILQTETDWRNNHTAGKLLDQYPLAGALVTLEARDIVSDGPPTDTSEYLELTVTATVDGVTQIATARAYVPAAAPSGVVAVDQSEFAIFAGDDIFLHDNATISRWPQAPQNELGRRLLLATQSTGSGSIVIDGNAACLDATLYHEVGASGSLVLNSGPAIETVELLDEIPFPDAPGPGVTYPFTTSNDLDMTSDTDVFSTDRRFEDGDMVNSHLTLQGNMILIIEDDLVLNNDSKILIDGNVTLVVFNDLYLDNGSSIELAPGAQLAIFFGDTIRLTNSYIGEDRPDDTRDNSGYAPYMDPRRILVFSIDDTGKTARWIRLLQNSVLKGTIYAPTMDCDIRNDSALYGSVAAIDIELTENGAIFYDHGLDLRSGYSNPASPLFDGAGGDIDSPFLGMSSLDPATLEAVATSMSIHILAFGETYGPGPPVSPPPDPTAPTPRTIPVQYHLVSFGTDMSQAEESLAGGPSGGGSEELPGP